MKIGLLTFHFSENWGAVFQAYALRAWLRSCGEDAEFASYHPRYVEEGKFTASPSVDGMKRNAKSAFLQFARLRSSLFNKDSLDDLEGFRVKHLGLSNTPLRSKALLEDAECDFDLLICGSDQIWNPSQQFGLDPVYFCNYRSSARRRISYAASFGSSSLPPEFHAELKEHLTALDAISVREEAGAEFAQTIIGQPVQCMPDPTFLLDNYNDLLDTNSVVQEGAIFAYVLRSGTGFPKLSQELAKTLGTSVVSGFNPLRRWKQIGTPVPGGPCAWLSNLKASKLVLTNSFHATVFSILFNRPFVAVRLPGTKAKLSNRLENLLDSVGLSSRMIEANQVERARELALEPIEWSTVNEAVSAMRLKGQAYLRENIVACSAMSVASMDEGMAHERA